MHVSKIRFALITAGLTFLTANVLAQEKNLTISAEGTPAFVLKVPQAANVTVNGDHTVVQTTETTFHVWRVSHAKKTDEALPHVPEIIKSEFVNFKPGATNDLVVVGSPARHISGKGNEADDGDPGAAEIVLFTAGKHVFAACAHGEFDDAARRSKVMLQMLKDAKAP